MADEVDQDNNDLHGGFRWANIWQTVFFVLQCMVMIVSLGLNMCLLRAMARNSTKEATVLYLSLVFFFFTSLVDLGLVMENFMSNFGLQTHTTGICRFVTFVILGNKLLQAFGVVALCYYAWTLIIYKTKRIENLVRQFFLFIIGGFIILEMIFALPPAMNLQGTPHYKYCRYIDDGINTIRLVGWLYEVLFPYFLPLLLISYPFGVILYKLRHHDSVSNRDRNHLQIVLAIVGGYFFFHFLYYLLWLGRQIESLLLDKSGFRDLLSHHIWYITRPLFATLNLGWHITTPLAPFIFDNELIEDFPGPWVNKHRSAHLASRRQEDIVLEERPSTSKSPDETDFNGIKVTKNGSDWTEIHNPLPSMEDEREYHQIPL